MTIARLATTVALLLGVVTSSLAAPVNLSFESGDFSGWSVTNPVGVSEFDGVIPAGSTQIVSTWPWGGARDPIDGFLMCAVGTGNSWFLPGQGNFDIDVHQTFSLESGTMISGSAFFYNGDFAAQDAAWVRILDGAGNILAVPWAQRSGSTNSTAFQTASSWTSWEWVAPTNGTYTLALGVSTSGDNRFATFGVHDGIRVPEPSSLVLLVAGVGAVVARQRRGRWSRGRNCAKPS
jgi:hypothetical protein